MKRIAALSMALLMLLTSVAVAGTQLTKDEKLALDASDIIATNYRYTMFDYIQVEAENGVLFLHGYATAPYKVRDYINEIKEELGEELEVVNQVEILPASYSDNKIRAAILRKVMVDGALLPYSFQRFPEPVHILVANGRVTLEGKVYSKMDKKLFEMKARSTFGVLSVENNLLYD